MKAAIYESFGRPLTIRELPDPKPDADGVVIRVMANGICRSDWHGWMGHDPDITLPHVPGHELAGEVEEVGSNVKRCRRGDRVSVPFVGGCGSCAECASGNQQVCERQFQPGFTHWGAFAERVAVGYADVNLVKLPDSIDYVTAASLGCRFATAFRAIVAQGQVAPDEWVAIHGCGGVGLSALMIARALGANVVGVDVGDDALELARSVGGGPTIDARATADVPAAIRDMTGGGAHVSLDALGSPKTCLDSIRSLRRRGRHVQVGILPPHEATPRVPMASVIAHELRIVGSHGLQAHAYDEMLGMIVSGRLEPGRLITRTVTLEQSLEVLESMGRFTSAGVVVIDRF